MIGAVSALTRIARIEGRELGPSMWSFACFFCILCGYYVLRPLRDEMGVQGGVENLPRLFLGTFVAMLAVVPVFGLAASRLPRRRLVPWTYLFFVANVLVFYVLFSEAASLTVARAFFVWVSVFNLFVVSLFWSLMADLFRPEQAARLFGFISAGGSCGALAGPTLTTLLAAPLGTANLLLVSCGFLSLALVCIQALLRRTGAPGDPPEGSGPPADSIGGTTWSGVAVILRSPYLLGIVAYVLLYTVLLGFVYLELARIVAATYDDSAQRTALFAQVDLAVNVLTLLGQLFLVARIVEKLGVGVALALLPALGLAGFITIGLVPVLAVLIAFQILRRAADYAVARPAREMLFTVLTREEKYKSKNFIDTVVFRGGDTASGWVYLGLKSLGLGLAGLAAAAIPGAILWLALGVWLGRRHSRMKG